MSLLKDAGGWSSTPMPLYYGGHSTEGSRYIAQYMVRPRAVVVVKLVTMDRSNNRVTNS